MLSKGCCCSQNATFLAIEEIAAPWRILILSMAAAVMDRSGSGRVCGGVR